MCAMRPSPKWVLAVGVYRKGDWKFDHRVASMPSLAFEGLEPCDGKLSCPVLRGLGVSNDPRLPGVVFKMLIFKDNARMVVDRRKDSSDHSQPS